MFSTKSRGGYRRPRYSTEFKADAVALVIEGERTIADVAMSLGLVEQPLHARPLEIFNRIRNPTVPRRQRSVPAKSPIRDL